MHTGNYKLLFDWNITDTLCYAWNHSGIENMKGRRNEYFLLLLAYGFTWNSCYCGVTGHARRANQDVRLLDRWSGRSPLFAPRHPLSAWGQERLHAHNLFFFDASHTPNIKWQPPVAYTKLQKILADINFMQEMKV